jgi:hypothetical protein
MPRRSTGPHLWLRKERRTKGKLVARATWLIIDNGKHIATGCDAGQAREAQGRLAEYIADKYCADRRFRDIEDIDIADVLALYDEDCRDRQANRLSSTRGCSDSPSGGVERCCLRLQVRRAVRMPRAVVDRAARVVTWKTYVPRSIITRRKDSTAAKLESSCQLRARHESVG